MSELLNKSFVSSAELETLLKEREAGNVDFILVDVREQMEYDMGHIKGVDMLKPTSTFLMKTKTKLLYLHVEQMLEVEVCREFSNKME